MEVRNQLVVSAQPEACNRRVEGVEDVEEVMDTDEPQADPEYAVAPHHPGIFAIAGHHQGNLGHREGEVFAVLPRLRSGFSPQVMAELSLQ